MVVAGPDSEFVGWHETTIREQGREPDFVLFGNHPENGFILDIMKFKTLGRGMD
jgi:hypothetical protein